MTIARLKTVILFIFITSCGRQHQSECSPPTASELKKNYIDLLENSAQGNIGTEHFSFKDKSNLYIKGGQYIYYNTNNLKEYSFYHNSQYPRFKEEFDETGNLVKREGNPILFTRIEEVSPDSLVFSLYISKLTIIPLKVFVVINGADSIEAFPTIEKVFSNSVSYRTGKRYTEKARIDFKTELSYRNCNGDIFNVSDSGFINH